jgi:hypothetical protein
VNRPDWTLLGVVALLVLLFAYAVVGVLMAEGVL